MKEIYLIYSDILGLYKIGVSKNSNIRIKKLQTGCPYILRIIFVFNSKYAHKVEKVLHKKFIAKKRNIDQDKIEGEWFDLEIDDVKGFILECQKIEERINFLKKSGNPFIE